MKLKSKQRIYFLYSYNADEKLAWVCVDTRNNKFEY